MIIRKGQYPNEPPNDQLIYPLNFNHQQRCIVCEFIITARRKLIKRLADHSELHFNVRVGVRHSY